MSLISRGLPKILFILGICTVVPFILFYVDRAMHDDISDIQERIALATNGILAQFEYLPDREYQNESQPELVDDSLPEQNQKAMEEKCSKTASCTASNRDVYNLHFIPHSHSDVGWLKTMDQYYSGKSGGNEASHQKSPECAKCVLDSVLVELSKNTQRKFMYVEMAFFSRWFSEQSNETKDVVRNLVDSGQLELVTGGWCSSDSATTYYDDIIDQHALGFQWINTTFGDCASSNVAWHIDQFGHSREHSSLLAQMGFDAIFLGRIDFQDLSQRKMDKNLQTIWVTSPENLGTKSSLFTSILYDGYFSPAGLGWEGRRPVKLNMDRNSEATRLIKTITDWAESYKTRHIMIPFGGDFAFQSASFWFDGMDQLIKDINTKYGDFVHAFYSSPGCYVRSVHMEAQQHTTTTDDFLPYSTIPNTFWTGFYTSRPGLKRHVKVASALLQACRELSVFARLHNSYQEVEVLKKAVAILQHHNAITGTEKQHVADDYNRMLSEGETLCQNVIIRAYERLSQQKLPQQVFCSNLNISVCYITETPDTFKMTVFNSLAMPVSRWIRLPVKRHEYSVVGPEASELKNEIFQLPSSTKRILERDSTSDPVEIVFKADVPPLGYSQYTISAKNKVGIPELMEKKFFDASMGRGRSLSKDIVGHLQTFVPIQADTSKSKYTISNEFLTLTVDPETGLTKSLKNLEDNVEIQLKQEFLYYVANKGQTKKKNDPEGGTLGSHKRSSGAYAFVPKEKTRPRSILEKGKGSVRVKKYKGDTVEEIHQTFSYWASQVIRLYRDAPYLELEWTIGPISARSHETKEVISRFTTNLKSNSLFYTDSNGRENMERRRDFRSTWPLNVTSPISGNYFPVTSRIFLKDEVMNTQFTVLTDRCQGGSSLEDGQLELMVHRRTFKDDQMGVREPLNEGGVYGKGLVIRGKHVVLLNTIAMAPQAYRPLALQVHRPLTLSFMSIEEGTTPEITQYSGLGSPLPPQVHLVTLDLCPDDPDCRLLRLENYYETSDIPEQENREIEVELQNLFSPFEIREVTELSLGANHPLTSVRRMQWLDGDNNETPAEIGRPDASDGLSPPFLVKLAPMEIRTFKVLAVLLGDGTSMRIWLKPCRKLD